MKPTNKAEDLAFLEESLEDVKRLPSAADRASEMVALADQITGVFEADEDDEEPEGPVTKEGQEDIYGLMDVPGAVRVLDKVRYELEGVLRSDEQWEGKEAQEARLAQLSDRVRQAERAASIRPEDRFRQAG